MRPSWRQGAVLAWPLIFGDPTNSNNWTRFQVLLNEGELVQLALENSNGAEQSSGTCTDGFQM